jgi:phosphoribosylformylglycinamidine synthase
VAIIREEGSNGDREMASAVYAAGMEPWDVHMSDLLAGAASLDAFQGIVFVGGFRCAAGQGQRGRGGCEGCSVT